MPANGDVVEQAGKRLLLLIVVSLRGLRSSENEGQAPEG